MDELQELKAKAEELAVDSLDWYTKDGGSAVVGFDWVSGDVYVIDPDSPDFPQVELAQFEGVDQLYKKEEVNG